MIAEATHDGEGNEPAGSRRGTVGREPTAGEAVGDAPASCAADGRSATTSGRTASRWRWLGTRVVVVLVAVTVVPVALLWVFQDLMVFAATDDVPPIAQIAPGARELTYVAADGTTLAGWYFPARARPTGCDHQPAVVLFHGQASTRASETPLATALAAHGVSVLVAEYRGFGGAEGAPSEDGLVLDAHAAADALGHQAGVDPAHLGYIGYSLGTGVAVRLAAERRPDALVLLAPYTSLPDMAWERLPGLPYRLLMRARFDSLEHIRHVDAPVLVVTGTADEVIPNEQSRRVYEAARHPAAHVEIPGADHLGVDRSAAGPAIEALTDVVLTGAGCPSS